MGRSTVHSICEIFASIRPNYDASQVSTDVVQYPVSQIRTPSWTSLTESLGGVP